MNILIISDTHGNYPLAIRAVDQVGPVDHIIHLGDGLEDALIVEEITGLPMTKVTGNCDFTTSAIKDIFLSFDGHSIFVTHGHRYRAKTGLEGLYQQAVEGGASVVLFGHTHLPLVQTVNDVLFINPGCLSQNCQTTTCALLTTSSAEVNVRIIDVK